MTDFFFVENVIGVFYVCFENKSMLLMACVIDAILSQCFDMLCDPHSVANVCIVWSVTIYR